MFKKLSLLTAGLLLSVSVFANEFLQGLIQKAENGDVQAQMELIGYCHNKQNYTNAFYWVEKLANQGNAKSQYMLGIIYDFGCGIIPQDNTKALEWYNKSANQGNAKAQNNLGAMYYNGYGVRQNYNIAKEWYGKSCENSGRIGCYNYKVLNEQGY
ncbi:sel1 repeat family protein [Moraxella nasibovis]|uniref:tetratricopeptide repeat protein n=1 Tax=Moraxella nasibovis TaxID=2904120 RepID=UPI00240EC8A5|nr:tetratricopeptide repeat protein [Moraxella nasibovis]WFF38383.1 sel1 repeat family protein [Moraxella nasibovis]